MIQVFSYKAEEIRVIERNGEPWFVAKDVCDVLGIANTSDAIKALDDDEKSTLRISEGTSKLGGNPNFNIINEPGLYALILRSNKPEAKLFSKWIRSEVLPTIRKTGSYNSQQGTLPSGALEGAKLILELAGIKDNQLVLALDKVYKGFTGYSALTMGEIELEAKSKRQLLTPTEIAQYFDGMNARKINDILAGAGYQYKLGDKWEPLKLGLPYAVMLDTNKKHSDGTPVRQLKWDSSIINQVSRLIRR